MTTLRDGGVSEPTVKRMGKWEGKGALNHFYDQAVLDPNGIFPAAGFIGEWQERYTLGRATIGKDFISQEPGMWDLVTAKCMAGTEEAIKATYPSDPRAIYFLQALQDLRLAFLQDSVFKLAEHPNHPLYVRHPLFQDKVFMAYFTATFAPAVRAAHERSLETYRVRCLPLADQVALRLDEKLDRLQHITSTPTKQPIPSPQPSLVSPRAKQLAEEQFRQRFLNKQLFIWPKSIPDLDTLEQVFFHGIGDQPAFIDYVDQDGNFDGSRGGWREATEAKPKSTQKSAYSHYKQLCLFLAEDLESNKAAVLKAMQLTKCSPHQAANFFKLRKKGCQPEANICNFKSVSSKLTSKYRNVVSFVDFEEALGC